MAVSRFCVEDKECVRSRRPEKVRPAMSILNRARQFAPFAALGNNGELLRRIEESAGADRVERIKDLSDFDPWDLSAEEADGLCSEEISGQGSR